VQGLLALGKAREMKKSRRDPDKSRLLEKVNWRYTNLNHNEREFLPKARNLLQSDQTLTRDQYAWLNKIYDRERHGRW